MTTSIQGSASYATEIPLSREVEVAAETPFQSRELSVTAPKEDTVTLSVSGEIEVLLHRGVGVEQIAETLGLTTGLVDSYLYVPLNGG
jgi:hypothetical protein